MTVKSLKVIENLPDYITPFGLGNFKYPDNWLTENNGENICHLNKFYGEATGMYWLWKNYMNNLKNTDWIGFCQYRRLWLNKLFESKQKNNISSLYSNLLNPTNEIFSGCEAILLQPTVISRQNLKAEFEAIYGENTLNKCLDFVDEKNKEDFKKYLNGHQMSICNMFITKPNIFISYCEDMFHWIEKCYDYCNKKNLLEGNNTRLPIFMVERFTSFWFEKYANVKYLSFARLGNFFLSEKTNKLINPLKIPLTFRMYPTIHRY
tara:strand:- start:1613 stop:2404 length:792 start_codon:yes stop_codon:yes gene_type:complete